MNRLPYTSTEQGQREASAVLAKLMGWKIGNKQSSTGAWMRVLCDAQGNDLGLRPPFGGGVAPKEQKLKPTKLFNLYDPANMALAWRVLNWAGMTQFFEDFSKWANARMDLTQIVVNGQDLPPDRAQKSWLDKILALAIEAGMVEP